MDTLCIHETSTECNYVHEQLGQNITIFVILLLCFFFFYLIKKVLHYIVQSWKFKRKIFVGQRLRRTNLLPTG